MVEERFEDLLESDLGAVRPSGRGFPTGVWRRLVPPVGWLYPRGRDTMPPRSRFAGAPSCRLLRRTPMKPKIQRTYSPTPADIERRWYVVDADGVPLGRLASQVAQILRGKHKPTFAPHIDGGDYVIVVNAEKVAVTGSKETQKVYYRHSGYPGGLRADPLGRVREQHPDRLVFAAVQGMLPKNTLGRQTLRKLKVYAGTDHPHEAQKPEPHVITHRKVEA